MTNEKQELEDSTRLILLSLSEKLRVLAEREDVSNIIVYHTQNRPLSQIYACDSSSPVALEQNGPQTLSIEIVDYLNCGKILSLGKIEGSK